ncbi:MAG: hypothetical protein HPZ91_12350 [Lentisphaeria bacterium]|nr:hypothetical protein [Lentisphaeria bacterium]
MTVLGIILGLIVQSAVGGVTLYLGSKITKDDVEWRQVFLIALAGALCGLIPFVGWLVGWGVMLMLLNKWCGCEPFPSGFLLILVSGLLQLLLGLAVGGLLVSLGGGAAA